MPRPPMREAALICALPGRYTCFNPRLPCGRRPCCHQSSLYAVFVFQSTPPMREATFCRSIQRLPMFQSTPPMREATMMSRPASTARFQSTPPMREATTWSCYLLKPAASFNPRLPCGRRLVARCARHRLRCFNPRLPCGRRPVSPGCRRMRHQICFNPRLPCGRRPARLDRLAAMHVSIHASHAGGDIQSFLKILCHAVSIHASHAGGDSWALDRLPDFDSFNPRLPCGRRHQFVSTVDL